MSSDYGAFMKQYNETNDRMLSDSTKLRDTERSPSGGTQNANAIVVMLIDASSHKVCCASRCSTDDTDMHLVL